MKLTGEFHKVNMNLSWIVGDGSGECKNGMDYEIDSRSQVYQKTESGLSGLSQTESGLSGLSQN